MTKETGIAAAFIIGGHDISGDVGSVQTIALRQTLLDLTGLDKSAHERKGGLGDGEMAFNSWFNTAAGASHAALSALSGSDRVATYLHRSDIGEAAAALYGKQVTYDTNRGQDGSLALTTQVHSAAGSPLEWGFNLTSGSQTFAAAANTASVDGTAATTSGSAAYLQVMSVGSGTVTCYVQDSANNSAFADVTGLVFTAATGRTSERVATTTSTALRRYTRLVTSGSFADAQIACVLVRYPG